MKLLLAVLAAAALAARAAAAPTPARPRNLILLIVDDLRADALGVYGGPATPRFDRLAAEGDVFTSAFSQAGWTLPSVSSILTGLYPTSHGAHRALPDDWPELIDEKGFRLSPGNSLPRGSPTLARALRRRGYRTLAVVSCPFGAKAFGFGQGFGEYANVGGDFANVDEEVARRLKNAAGGPPFFLYVHVMDVHEGAEDPADTPERKARMKADYARGVKTADAGLGVLLDGLSAAGLLKTTVVAVTADHGEEFWERGRHGHGDSPYAEALRVPLILSVPGEGAGRRIAAPVQTIDLFPTFLDAAGLPPEPVEGASLMPLLRGAAQPERAAISEVYPHTPALNNVRTAVALRTARWTVVSRPGAADELYDRSADPAETKNRAQARPEIVRELRARLDAWQAGLRRPAPSGGRAPALPADQAERLRRMGYLKEPAKN